MVPLDNGIFGYAALFKSIVLRVELYAAERCDATIRCGGGWWTPGSDALDPITVDDVAGVCATWATLKIGWFLEGVAHVVTVGTLTLQSAPLGSQDRSPILGGHVRVHRRGVRTGVLHRASLYRPATLQRLI